MSRDASMIPMQIKNISLTRLNKSISLQVKKIRVDPTIRGDRSLQVTESPSRQVYEQKDTCRYPRYAEIEVFIVLKTNSCRRNLKI